MRKVVLFSILCLAILSCSSDDNGSNNEPNANCSEPVGLRIQTLSTTSAGLFWTPIEEDTPHTLEYGLQGFTLGTGSQDASSFGNVGIQGLEPSTIYDFYVTANCGSDGNSSAAGPVSFTTRDCVKVVDLSFILLEDTSVVIEWEQGSNLIFEVEYGLSGFAVGTGIIKAASGRQESLEGLTASTDYDVYVRAICGSTIGEDSDVFQFTTAD